MAVYSHDAGIPYFQLKLYAQKQSINPEIDDTYSAKGGNGDTWKERLENDKRIAHIIVCAQIFVATFAVIFIGCITAARLLPKLCVRNGDEGEQFCQCSESSRIKLVNLFKSNDTIAIIFCSSAISTLINIYVLALDCAAVDYRNKQEDVDLKVIHNWESLGSSYDILYNLPVIVLVFDLISTVLCGIIVIFSSCFLIIRPTSECCFDNREERSAFSACCLSTSTLSAVFCILMHIPYISIAFLNDAYHAGSMFIYYSLLIFALFVVIELMFKAMFKCKDSYFNRKQFSDLDSAREFFCPSSALLVFLLVALLFFVSLVISITCYFVIIPINKSISDAPNRLIGLYQSGVIVIAAIVLYKAFLRRNRNPLVTAIKKYNDFDSEWKTLSEEEKQGRFYNKVITIVKNLAKEDKPVL